MVGKSCRACGENVCRKPKVACASGPKPPRPRCMTARPRLRSHAARRRRRWRMLSRPMRVCAKRSISCRKASSSSMPKAATFSGTSNTPTSTSAAPTCSLPARKLDDTLRIGIARGDYPEAIGREEEWLEGAPLASRQSARPARAAPLRRPLDHDRGAPHQRWRRDRPARRHHRDEAARGVVPPAVRRQSGADVRLCARRLNAFSRSTTPRSRITAMTARTLLAMRSAADPGRRRSDRIPRSGYGCRGSRRRQDLEAPQGRRQHDRRRDLLAAADA